MLYRFRRFFNSREFRLAWLVAIATDGIQILILPLFVPGGLSPADTFIDLAAALLLSKLIGWHWAFLPTLVAELLPGLDLFPTWTAAVLYVISRRIHGEPATEFRDVTPRRVPKFLK